MGARPTTTTAVQALILLNNEFVNEQAAALARRVRDEAGDEPAARVERAFQRVLARDPDADEARIAPTTCAAKPSSSRRCPGHSS